MGGSQRQVPVSEVMTRDVSTVVPGDRLARVSKIFVEERCHHVPVVKDGKPVGMISTRDLVALVEREGAGSILPDGDHEAADVMSRELRTIYLDQPVELAIERIGPGDIHALIVLDHDDGLAGIVTQHDLLRYMMT